MEERRKFIRLGLRVNASYKVLETGESHEALTRNVGGGGISLFTEKKLDTDTMLSITITISDRNRPIEFTARVVWSGALILSEGDETPHLFETGVKFVDISPENHAMILQYTAKGSG